MHENAITTDQLALHDVRKTRFGIRPAPMLLVERQSRSSGGS
jgi:hypothetical protein